MSRLSTIRFTWRGLPVVLSGLALACLATGTAAATRNCVTVSVPDPLQLPDGSIHPAGSLTLCSARSLSPVTQLHQVSVDGIPVGFLLSRMGLSEGPGPAEPLVTFHRDRKGRLLLIGYAWPAGRHSQTYLLKDPRPPSGEPVAAEQTTRSEAGHEIEAPDLRPLLAAISP